MNESLRQTAEQNVETYVKVMNEAIAKLSIIVNELAKISVIEGIQDENHSEN